MNDVKEYIYSQPGQLDWQQINLDDIGSRLVELNQQQYLGRLAAQWDLDLEPLPGHFDKRTTVTTPLQKAGAYLLTARMEGGNMSRIVVWLDDTVIIKKPLANATYYFVADARTGQPVPGPTSNCSGGGMLAVDRQNESRLETKNWRSRPTTTASSVVPVADPPNQQALPMARHRDDSGRPARAPWVLEYLGRRCAGLRL